MNVSSVAHGHHSAHKPNASHNAKNFEGVLHGHLHGQNKRTGITAKKDEAQRSMGCKICGEDVQTLRAKCCRGLFGAAMQELDETQTSQFDYSEYNGKLDINRVDRKAAEYMYHKTFDFIFDALKEKIDPAKEVAEKLSNMIINREDADLETRAADREAARDLAQYIADSYFDDPEEAQAFMEEINRRIEDSELIDKGYVLSKEAAAVYRTYGDPKLVQAYLEDLNEHIERISESEREKYGISFVRELVKPEHPLSDMEIWLEKNGLDGFYDEETRAKFDKEQRIHYEKTNIYYTTRGSLDLNSGGSVCDGWVLINLEDMEDNKEDILANQKPWELIGQNASELKKIRNCTLSMYSEEHKAWYAEYESNAKVNAAQGAIDNAKKITDFSGNDKWNSIMNLLPSVDQEKIAQPKSIVEPTPAKEEPIGIEAAARNDILTALDGKIDADIDIYEVSSLLTEMLFSDDPNLEIRAANREAGKDMAKRLAENYFNGPKEAQAFMDIINKLAETSEARDKGYTPAKPQPPSDLDRWLEQKGYTELFYVLNTLRRLDYRNDGVQKIIDEYKQERSNYEEEHPGSSISDPFSPIDWNKTLSWEKIKKMSCDPKYSMYSEENKTWYAEFELAQNIIDNAKKITDFSGNDMWNDLMNLLPKAA